MSAADFLRRATRSRGYRKLTERRDGPLNMARATARLSAYVYGNILALGAVVVATPESIADGEAALVVAATGATTFVAHVFSDFVAYGGLRSADDTDEAGAAHERDHALAELRDATPIATSATFPTLALLLGWSGLIPTSWAFALAGGIVVFRIATVQMVAKRIRGVALTPRILFAGLLTAAFAAAIVALKIALTH